MKKSTKWILVGIIVIVIVLAAYAMLSKPPQCSPLEEDVIHASKGECYCPEDIIMPTGEPTAQWLEAEGGYICVYLE